MEVLSLLVGVVLGAGVGVMLGVLLERRRAAGTDGPGAAAAGQRGDLEIVRSAFEALSTGVVLVDAAGQELVRNRAATTLGGAVHSDILLQEALEVLLAAALGGEARRQVLDLHGPPRRVLVVSARPRAEGGALATIDDITERARLDAVRTDFVANISHELRTPVGALAVLAETLSEADEPEVVDRLSRKMVEEAHRVARTIDDLLELSRIELGGTAMREQIRIADLLDDAAARVKPFADARRIAIDVRPIGRDATLLGDRRQLTSAVGNLIENAVKYSEAGQAVEVACTAGDDLVELVVTDHGVGIPARDLDRVFERFYRVDRARSRETGGTGLGLAIVRHVATNHGGQVTVESVEGEGSTFRLRIPRAGQPTGSIQETA